MVDALPSKETLDKRDLFNLTLQSNLETPIFLELKILYLNLKILLRSIMDCIGKTFKVGAYG